IILDHFFQLRFPKLDIDDIFAWGIPQVSSKKNLFYHEPKPDAIVDLMAEPFARPYCSLFEPS
ncbi:unnamed protein product, partial [Rotaria magnacalcarata]